MDGRKVRMSDVPSKDCNGVLRMQVMIAIGCRSVRARSRQRTSMLHSVHVSHLED
jgi:hypothetical protein